MPSGIYDHHKIKKPRETRVCAAPGCNNTFECKVNSRRKYCCAYKHHKQSKETIEKRSMSMLGKNKKPRETRICGCGCKGTFECKVDSKQRFIWGHNIKGELNPSCRNPHPAWNRGLTKETDERVAKYGRSGGETRRRNGTNKSIGEKNSKNIKRFWQTPEYVAKQMEARGVKPNKPEKFLTKLFQKLFPNQWKYVGDGQFILAGKCPDFVNINGQKKIIELYGDYWHKDDNPQDRIDLFAKYGYQTLVIWEHELKDIKQLLGKLMGFCK